MTLLATCSGCEKEHPVGSRPTCRGTTECPDCGNLGYSSSADSEITRSEEERIYDAIEGIDGVGPATRENIQNGFDYYAGLSGASIDELSQIDGVGQKTAERIQKRAI